METKDSYLDGLRELLPVFEGRDHILNIHILKVLPNTALMDEHEIFKIILKNKNNVIEASTMDRETLLNIQLELHE